MQYATPEALEIALTKHFVVLDVIAANAPWLGLMGTVFSVMLFFGMMSPENKIDAIGLMQVFASALKTTLIGLLLALCVDTSQRILRRSVHVLMLTWQDMRRLQRGEY
jgi:biopolymer transport protein ExbB